MPPLPLLSLQPLLSSYRNPVWLLVTFVATAFMSAHSLVAYSQKTSPPQAFHWTQATVTILAKGYSALSSTGNMDSYLVLISPRKRGQEPILGRLVDYYPFLFSSISDEHVSSGQTLRLTISDASYCSMDDKDFKVSLVIDQEKFAGLQAETKTLPCFILRR